MLVSDTILYTFAVESYSKVVSDFSCYPFIQLLTKYFQFYLCRIPSFSPILEHTALATVHQLSPPNTLYP